MIIIIGLIILVAAVVVGVAGVLGNGGTHGLAHGFSVLGYHITGSGTVFLYGIAVGVIALFGLWLLLTGARRTARRGSAARRGLKKSRQETAQSRQETAAVSKARDDLIDQRDTARAYTASALTGTVPSPLRAPARITVASPARRRATAPGRACSAAGPLPRRRPPPTRNRWPASPPPRFRPARRPPRCPLVPPPRQITPWRLASHEHRQEDRAQGRSGQRRRSRNRRPGHRQPAPARRRPQ